MPAEGTLQVYVDETPPQAPPVVRADLSVAAFVGLAAQGPLHTPVQVLDFAGFEASFGGLASGQELPWALWQFFGNGGDAAWVVRVPDLAPATLAGQRAAGQGLFALDAVDPAGDFGLLCLPGVTEPQVLQAAAGYCEQRHAFLIVDAPATAQSARGLRDVLSHLPASSNAAFYHPWLQVADPHGGMARSCAPSGTLAGVYARTDRTRGPWAAPAGSAAVLQGVQQLAFTLDEDELEALRLLGANDLRQLPGTGLLAWGARTLRPADPAWKYIAVRRLALLLQRSLGQGLRWAVFEPNDAALWMRLRTAAEGFLFNLWRDGALAGNRFEQAGFAQCGLGQTMTEADIARGQARLTIGFAAQRPAEFMVFGLEFETAG
ncbi:MAG: phage tail sheath family protein [Proteobacteria bacterium]|nr:phage tail sheath family protein [Pseudomonadota bacterium]